MQRWLTTNTKPELDRLAREPRTTRLWRCLRGCPCCLRCRSCLAPTAQPWCCCLRCCCCLALATQPEAPRSLPRAPTLLQDPLNSGVPQACGLCGALPRVPCPVVWVSYPSEEIFFLPCIISRGRFSGLHYTPAERRLAGLIRKWLFCIALWHPLTIFLPLFALLPGLEIDVHGCLFDSGLVWDRGHVQACRRLGGGTPVTSGRNSN